MKKLVMTIWLCSCIILPIFCQININFEHNCLKQNSAIISKAIIKTFGEGTVKQLLENKANIVFVCNIDSMGHLLKIEKILSKQKLSNDFVHLLEDYLLKSKVCFFICISQSPQGINKCRVIKEERIKFQKNNNRIISSVAFPGELMNLFEYERKRAEIQGFKLNKYDYLLSQIKKYEVVEYAFRLHQGYNSDQTTDTRYYINDEKELSANVSRTSENSGTGS